MITAPFHDDHCGRHHRTFTDIDLIAAVAGSNPTIVWRNRAHLFVIAPIKRIAIDRHAVRRDRSTGGAQASMADASATIYLPTMDAAHHIAFTDVVRADRAGCRTAWTDQFMTDAALHEIAIADEMPAARQPHAMFGADGAIADDAVRHADRAAFSITDNTASQVMAQRMADRALTQTLMTIRSLIGCVDRVEPRPNHAAAASARHQAILAEALAAGAAHPVLRAVLPASRTAHCTARTDQRRLLRPPCDAIEP